MNFNPMDLIIVKELFYRYNAIPFQIISQFINKLTDLQAQPEILEGMPLDDKTKEWLRTFLLKQEMIEHSYKIKNLDKPKMGGF